LRFAEIFGIRKRVHGLSCGVVCVILRLPVSVEHPLVTDRHTTTAYTALAWRRAVKLYNIDHHNSYQQIPVCSSTPFVQKIRLAHWNRLEEDVIEPGMRGANAVSNSALQPHCRSTSLIIEPEPYKTPANPCYL